MKWAMLATILCVACIVMTKLAHAEKVLKELSWDKAPEDAELVEAKAPATQPSLKVAGKERRRQRESDDRREPFGHVGSLCDNGAGPLRERRRQRVPGDVEHVPDDNAYFSKTLSALGPMGVIKGTSGWRKFSLPFNSKEGYYPKELTVSVVLPGKGTVELKDLKLVQPFADDEAGTEPVALRWAPGGMSRPAGGLARSRAWCWEPSERSRACWRRGDEPKD
jgi:hypothetical protein